MGCSANLAPLGRSCSPQIGGTKNIYLISAPGGSNFNLLAGSPGSFPTIGFGRGADEETGALYFGFHVENVETAEDLLALITEDGLTPSDLDYTIARIDVTRQGATITSSAQISKENGSGFYKNVATIPTVGLLPETVALVHKLAAIGCVVIGESYDGRFQAIGFSERATLETGELTTGANFGDNPGASIVLSCEEPVPMAADLAILDEEYFLVERNSAALSSFFRQIALSA